MVKLILVDNKTYYIRFALKIAVNEAQISLRSYIHKSPDGLILSKKHFEIHTVIHLQGVAPYILLKFDEENQFESPDFSANSKSLVSIQTTSQTILIMKIPNSILDKKIESVVFITH